LILFVPGASRLEESHVPRELVLAAVQPPAPGGATDRRDVVDTALELLDQAGGAGADIVCLPECLNVVGLDEDGWRDPPPVEELLDPVAALAGRHATYVILPLLERRADRRYNTALIVDRNGAVIGRYDKTHLTAAERDRYGITRGEAYPVFDLDCGRVGIMICYDGHFSEVGRLLTLEGAEILFFPALQRHLTASMLEVQVRARAVDNCAYLVRASYGYPAGVAWTPGMMVGKSCIVDFEGTILADAGPRVGLCLQRIDLDRPRIKERSFGSETGDARKFIGEDRRPETYGRLIRR